MDPAALRRNIPAQHLSCRLEIQKQQCRHPQQLPSPATPAWGSPALLAPQEPSSSSSCHTGSERRAHSLIKRELSEIKLPAISQLGEQSGFVKKKKKPTTILLTFGNLNVETSCKNPPKRISYKKASRGFL